MPLAPAYDRLIDTPAADMKNIGGRYGGSITAAQFLQRFIQKGTPWAHLDIAGVTWSEKAEIARAVRARSRFMQSLPLWRGTAAAAVDDIT